MNNLLHSVSRGLLLVLGVSLLSLIFVRPSTVEAVHTTLAPWLCNDGTFTSETQHEGACERLGKVTVPIDIRDACHDFPTAAERRTCMADHGVEVVDQFAIEGKCETLVPGDCPIIQYILIITNVLSAAVGVVVVIMIAVAGVQYTSSRDNPQGVAAARQRIFNAILAMLIYLAVAAFLQWLVPGGVFSS